MAQDFNFLESRPQQYNSSKTINAILSGMNDRVKVSYPELIQKVFDVDTAEGRQLEVLAERVGATRVINFPVNISDEEFGFDDDDWYGFGPDGGTFYHPQTTDKGTLTDEALRTYIRFKCFSNISSGSLADLNAALLRLFPGRGPCHASVTDDLELTLTFGFALSTLEQALLKNRYFPVPAGYSLKIISTI